MTLDLLPDAPPAKFARARTPGLRTLGPQVGMVSAELRDRQGRPAVFMPWQQQVADVALELHPERPGAWRYPVVIVTVPRQSGKTTLARAVSIHRAMHVPQSQIFLTAQTGKDARARWRDWVLAATAATSPFAQFVNVRRAVGTEALSFPNASEISPFAPTPTSLHGYTPPLVLIDEGWSFDPISGSALMAAIAPAQATLPGRQLWMLSTAGDADSEWWHEQCDLGRESVTDPDSDIAYFEWSADESLDPYDPVTLDFHPAIGYTQDRADLIALSARETPGNWRRGFLNLRTLARETVVDLDVWDTLDRHHHGPDHIPDITECVIGYAVADDRSGSAIWAVHLNERRQPCLHLSATAPGSAWLTAALQDLYAQGPAALVAYDRSHTRPVTATLETAGITVHPLTAADWAAASSNVLQHITDRTIHHDGATELRDALDVVALKRVAGGRAFDAPSSAGPIDHLAAAAAATWHAEHTPTSIPIY